MGIINILLLIYGEESTLPKSFGEDLKKFTLLHYTLLYTWRGWEIVIYNGWLYIWTRDIFPAFLLSLSLSFFHPPPLALFFSFW